MSLDRLVTVRLMGELVLIATMTFAVGCSDGDRPDIGSVTGTVKLDGKPMPDAMVQFKTPGFRLSKGFTSPAGKYELVYLRNIKGAAIGKHSVFIDRVTGYESTPQHLRLPARYNDRTTLVVDVQPGDNVFDFDLRSDQ